jgi:hypothetical protein
MTYEQFQTEVETMIANLTAVAKLGGAGWAFKYHDVSLSRFANAPQRSAGSTLPSPRCSTASSVKTL